MKKTVNTYVTIWVLLLTIFTALFFVFAIQDITTCLPLIPDGVTTDRNLMTPDQQQALAYNESCLTTAIISAVLKLLPMLGMFIVQLVLFLKTYKPDTVQKRFYIFKFKATSFVMLGISGAAMCGTAVIPAISYDITAPKNAFNQIHIVANILPGVIAAALAVVLLIIIIAIALTNKWLIANIVRLDEEAAYETSFAKNMLVNVEFLTTYAKSAETKAACKKVYEAIRYCDPTANASIRSFEEVINMKFSDFDYAVKSDNGEKANEIANEIVALTNNRNNKCMLAH